MARSNWMDGFEIKKRSPGPVGRESGRVRASAPGLASGETARALYVALKARAAEKGITLGAAHKAADIGVSTLHKLRNSRPVRQSVVLKVCAYLGVSVANVLATPQQKGQ